MSIKSRIEKLEQRTPAHENGRIIAAWMFDTLEAYEAAKLQHVELYPNHQGIRFIEYGKGACVRHDHEKSTDDDTLHITYVDDWRA